MTTPEPGEPTPTIAASSTSPATAAAASTTALFDVCWRCGQPVAIDQSHCGACAAVMFTRSHDPELADKSVNALVRMVWVYIVLLTISVVHGLLLYVDAERLPAGHDGAQKVNWWQLLAVEAIMSAVVLGGVAVVRFPPREARPPLGIRFTSWLLAVPLLALMLAFNIGYHRLLIDVLHLQQLKSDLQGHPELLPLAVLAICVQPAIIEEIFFRGLAFGWLRTAMSDRMAVVISAVMFGLAHLGVPLSIPLLIVLGLCLGLLRSTSGSLTLPVLFHFAHNAFVVIWEMIE